MCASHPDGHVQVLVLADRRECVEPFVSQGGANYLSVYYAKKQHDTTNDKESCPARNAKLYFCGTPAGLRRDSILALFSAFGRVRHLQVYTDSYGVLSSGTVTMYSTDEAIAAMNSLDGKVLQSGTAPLKVSAAGPKQSL
jgi:hypothetical protein